MNASISNLMQVASLRRYTLTEGNAAGLEVIDCDNGKLRFLINVSCALDIMQLFHEGQNVSFISKNGFSAKHTDFSSRFEGGMLYTCGLDSIGARDGFETHGTLHEKHATLTRTECTEDGITVEGYMTDTALFGKNLVLKRKIYSALGSETVTVEDTLTNSGSRAENFCVLYHVNLGYPMIDDGATIEADIKGCEPRNDWAKRNEKTAFITEAPLPCREETCYYLTLGKPEISVVNSAIGKKFTLAYEGEALTSFIEWKSMACGDYALGLEPCTSGLDDKFEYKNLAIGDSVRNAVSLTVTKL